MLTIAPSIEKLWVNVVISTIGYPLGLFLSYLYMGYERGRFSYGLLGSAVLGLTGIEGPRCCLLSRERLVLDYDKIVKVVTGRPRWFGVSRILSENKDMIITISSSISDEDYNRILEKLKEVGVSL